MTEPQHLPLRQRIAGYTYRTLRWGRDHVPPVIRSVIGTQKTLVYVGLVIVAATVTGMVYGAIVG